MDIIPGFQESPAASGGWQGISHQEGSLIMPHIGPIKRKDLVRYLRRLGFDGPYSGGKHQFMAKGDITLRLPNPHQGDIGKEFLLRILRQARIDINEWEEL